VTSRALAPIVALALLLPVGASQAQVAFERAGFRLTSIGERLTVSGRVVDASRRPVATGSIRWRVADPSIASVTPQGVVVSKKVGNTKLWAVAGDDSASALILVDQWAAKFDFLPPSLRLDAKGEKKPLRIIVRDAGGFPIASQNRRVANCRSLNDRVALLSQTGEVMAVANGVTWIRCADRGIADSARVEVRQRPVRATIADKSALAVRVLGDTFRLRINATDASGDPIANPQSTWASLNPTIVSVDPLSGLARGVGMGTARIVAQAGDVVDTISIGIAQGAGLPVPANSDTAIATRSLLPTLRFTPTYPFVGDTAPLQYAVRDPNGVEIANARVELESSDTSVFVVLSRGRILPKREGSAYARGRFGEIVDSGQVIVRPRSVVNFSRDSSNVEQRAFVRPTFDTERLLRLYAARRDTALKEIFDSTRIQGLKAPWLSIAASAAMGQAYHSFSDSTGKENRSGFVYGGGVDLQAFKYFHLGGEFRTGSLTATGTSGTELGLTEASGTAAFSKPSFSAGVSYTLRATREGPSGPPAAALAIQQWTIPRVFVSFRPAFIGGAIRTIMGVNALVGGTYTGYFDANGDQLNPLPLSMGGQAGLEFTVRGFSIGMLYDVESFKFDKVGTSERRDQFSTVRLKAGWQYSK
jgi:hypothetical protein